MVQVTVKTLLHVLWRDRNDLGSDLRGIGNAYAEITILKDLRFKSLFGFDYRSYNGKDIFMRNPEFTEAKPADISYHFKQLYPSVELGKYTDLYQDFC